MEPLQVKCHGTSITVTDDVFTITANNMAGRGALGAEQIDITYPEITGFHIKTPSMLTNGTLTIGTDFGKVQVHFMKKSAPGIDQAREVLEEQGIDEDKSVTSLPMYSPKVLAMKAKAASKEAQREADKLAKNGEKICPDCAETIKAAARKCRFCGYEFD